MIDEVAENALGHINLAREYFDAVDALNVGAQSAGPDCPRPVLQMLGIGLETGMKADLIFSGVSEASLKDDFGHRLAKLYSSIDTDRRNTAAQSAGRTYIAKLRGWRDEYENSLPPVARRFDNIPNNDDIGNSIPKAQALMDRFAPLYAADKGLRYFVSYFDSSVRLPFPPHSDIPALFLSLWGNALLEVLENDIRDRMRGAASA